MSTGGQVDFLTSWQRRTCSELLGGKTIFRDMWTEFKSCSPTYKLWDPRELTLGLSL